MISHKLKVNISLDERGQPVDCDSYQRTEANTLVEEVC
jgi:exoribonuclease R